VQSFRSTDRSLSRLVGPGSLLAGRRRQHADHALAGARDGVAGCLEILLFGEQEYNRAGLARVGRWDVEVEDGADVAVDFAVV